MEGESSSTKHYESRNKINQGHQSYQYRGRSGDGNSVIRGNSGRGQRKILRGSANQTVTTRQAFVGECDELSWEFLT